MTIETKPAAWLGLTQKEIARWSLKRVLNAIEQDPIKMPGAEYERGLSNDIEGCFGIPSRPGFIQVPLDVQTRVLTAASQGANLIATPTYAAGASFATALRGADPLQVFNVERVGPLVGSFAMPRVATAPTATWLTNESTNITEAAPTYGQQATSPKSVGAFFTYSRSLSISTPPEVFDAIVIGELSRTLAAAVATAFINGSGTAGQPTGIIGTSGVASQSGTALAFAGILTMIAAVENAGLANPARAGFVLGKDAAKLMRTRERAAGSGTILEAGQIEGFKAVVTSCAPADAILFGDFSRAALAEWGQLEIGADPFTQFQSGITSARAIWSVDVLVMQPTAFAKSTSVT